MDFIIVGIEEGLHGRVSYNNPYSAHFFTWAENATANDTLPYLIRDSFFAELRPSNKGFR